MKIPAVSIAAALASGIFFGLQPIFAQYAASRIFIAGIFLTILIFFSAGFFLAKWRTLWPSAIISLLCWVLLGFCGALLSEQPRAANHVRSLADNGALNLKVPLRWHGQLRDEPEKLPWGYGYEIELASVDIDGTPVSVSGGLRLSCALESNETPPDVHAGDRVSAITDARLPRNFKDEGAFDRRANLEQQHVNLLATLRSPKLLQREGLAQPNLYTRIAHTRRRFQEEIDSLFAAKPEIAGVLRAMLLGDRNFIDQTEAISFQKTGVFHVLVVAGLHTAAIASVLFWLGRKLKFSFLWTIVLTTGALVAYVMIVEQRSPVLRAALMATIVICGRFFYRRLDLLNSAAIAAVILLIARPAAMRDSSFQLTFLAIGCIAGIAVPWLDRTVQPYARALQGWRDVTRDASHEPKAAQFRIDLRFFLRWLFAKLPQRTNNIAENLLVSSLSMVFRAWELFALTAVLQIGMLPLMARDFHRISVTAPLVNLAVVPLIGVLVPMGFITLGSGLIWHSFAKILSVPLSWLTDFLIHVVRWFADFHRESYRIPGPPVWLVALFLIVLVGIAWLLRNGQFAPRWSKFVMTIGLVASVITVATYPFAAQWIKGSLEITFLDVGQGDSIFVVFPDGKTLLIDGGGAFAGFSEHEQWKGIDPGEEAVSPYLWSRGFQKLDFVALTHAHQDHLGGLAAVLENFHVGELWIGKEVALPALAKLEQEAVNRGTAVRHVRYPQTFSWDGVQGEFLWPQAESEIAPIAKNDDSLVLRLHYKQRAVMLPGDAERQAEEGILAEDSKNNLRSDLLKVGHHGSKNSTTLEFLEAVRPNLAVISSGPDNPYGHPSPELLERLRAAGIWTLRTDLDGAVHVLTDGDKMEVTCFVPCSAALSEARSVQTHTPDQKQNSHQQ